MISLWSHIFGNKILYFWTINTSKVNFPFLNPFFVAATRSKDGIGRLNQSGDIICPVLHWLTYVQIRVLLKGEKSISLSTSYLLNPECLCYLIFLLDPYSKMNWRKNRTRLYIQSELEKISHCVSHNINFQKLYYIEHLPHKVL